jgi:competence protein ComEC
MIVIVRGLGAPSVSSVQVTWINPLFIAIYYVVLILALWLFSRRKKITSMISGVSGVMKAGVNLTFGFSGTNMRLVVVPLLLAAVLTTYTVTTLPDNDLHVSFLDVGEGDAILLQQGSTQVLIDGGPSPQAVTLALSRQMPFWDRTIELVVLTHPHSDHLAGLVEVLKRYKVKEVVYPSANDSSPIFQEWLALLKDKEIKVITACAGRQITVGKLMTIEVLNPQTKMLTGTESDVDNNCVALRVQEGKISFLLTGDMMNETETELTRHRADLACTVLKAAHHGSDTSSTQAFLTVADPQIAVISCGAGNKFGHPNEAALERLEESVGESNIYRTDMRGTINFITDGEKLWIKTEK